MEKQTPEQSTPNQTVIEMQVEWAMEALQLSEVKRPAKSRMVIYLENLTIEQVEHIARKNEVVIFPPTAGVPYAWSILKHPTVENAFVYVQTGREAIPNPIYNN